MLADIGDDQVPAAGQPREPVDHRLHQQLALVPHGGFNLPAQILRHHLAPLGDFAEPAPARLGGQHRFAEQDVQGAVDIGIDGDGRLHVLADFGGVDLHVDDIGVLGVLLKLAGHPVVEAHAEGNQQIGLHDGAVGLDGAVHAHHAQTQGVIRRHGRQAVQSEGDRNVDLFGELTQKLAGVAGDDPVAAEDDRPFAAVDQFDRLFHRFACRGRVVEEAGQMRAEVTAVELVALGNGGVLDVLGDIEHHRPATPGGGDVEGFVYRPFDLLDIQGHVGLFADRHHDPDHVAFLKGVGSDDAGGDLAGDGDDGDRVHVGVGDAGDQVHGPRAAGGHADADLRFVG